MVIVAATALRDDFIIFVQRQLLPVVGSKREIFEEIQLNHCQAEVGWMKPWTRAKLEPAVLR